MALSRLHSATFLGLDAVLVEVEVDVKPTAEKQILVIVGLPDNAVRESKDRVLAALRNSGFETGCYYCTVNLAPGNLRKEGPLYDLPIAIGLLHSAKVIPESALYQDYLFVGELGLGGEIRPIQGALGIALMASELGKKGVVLPKANADEAAAVPNVEIIGIEHLKEAVQFLKNPASVARMTTQDSGKLFQNGTPSIDFADIKGQTHVKRAMEIVAAGGHNVVLIGPPGSGKTMLAKALIGIMPQLSLAEALETTKIHSVAGMLPPHQGIVTQRPFRAPHHTVSYAGLIGGGSLPRPGEVSLAHNGILFLDELPEFSKSVLEVLRQPLEDRKVTISRANGNFTFPTSFICVAAMNPCPCGMAGHPDKPCKDTQVQIDRYKNKISGPLWDRIDMHLEVPALRYRDMSKEASGESSAAIRGRVMAARDLQRRRFGTEKTNALMSSREIKQYAPLSEECEELLREVVDVMGMSARGCDRLIRVSRTIADLENGSEITRENLLEAIAYRSLQR